MQLFCVDNVYPGLHPKLDLWDRFQARPDSSHAAKLVRAQAAGHRIPVLRQRCEMQLGGG